MTIYGCRQNKKQQQPSLTRRWSSLKPSVMVVDNNKKQLVNTRGIPKTHRVLGSTNIKPSDRGQIRINYDKSE